jgi:lipoprotein-anchoring transpeptidase ErfK/SrfK
MGLGMPHWFRAAAGGLAVLVIASNLATPAVADSRYITRPFWAPPDNSHWGPPRYTWRRAQPAQNRYQINPIFLRQTVAYPTSEKAGTLIVDTGHKFLYLVLGNGQALRYGIGTARDGFEWSGVHKITNKREWPDWTPPAEMIARQPGIPHHMAGGPNNPLGARALYIGSTLYRIHGTNEPWTIGGDVSSGCIRMVNDDVIDLYSRVKIGAKVIVL